MRHRRRNKAFTLIEVVISLLVLTIGIVGVLTLLPLGLKASKRGMDITQAAFYAQEKMEEIKRDGYAQLESLPEEPIESNPRFSCTVEAGEEIIPPGNLKEIKVTISWSEGNQNYAEEFKTLITKY